MTGFKAVDDFLGDPAGEIISVHLYSLREGVTPQDLYETAREAAEQKLFDLPGLVTWWFAERIKGSLTGEVASFWVYESRAAWEALWGTPQDSLPPSDYPKQWVIWEQEYLGPLLDRPADEIEFGSYQIWISDQFKPPQAD